MKGVISGVMKSSDAPIIRAMNTTKRIGVRRTLQYQIINVTNAKTDRAAKIKTRVKTNQHATVSAWRLKNKPPITVVMVRTEPKIITAQKVTLFNNARNLSALETLGVLDLFFAGFCVTWVLELRWISL